MADEKMMASTTTTTDVVAAAPNDNNSLSKKERGRLKKLLKRARTAPSNSGLSGILTNDDWRELLELSSRQNEQVLGLGPSIHCHNDSKKKKKKKKEHIVVEGSDHRGILYRVLLSNHHHSGTKRKRNSIEIKRKPPKWATLHNLGAVEHVGVLEIHINDDNGDAMNELRDRLKSIANKQGAHVSSTKTKWCKSQQIQSITDRLMYAPLSKSDLEGSDQSPTITTLKELHTALQELTLPMDQWNKEGYPTIEPSTHETLSVELEPPVVSMENPFDMTLDQAKAIVRTHQVHIESPDNVQDELPPFVATPHQQQCALPPSRILALDCEMVQTTAGSELARITLVQAESLVDDEVQTKVLWDKLVRPKHKVVDYLTEYSGVTEALLKNVTLELEQVQAALLTTVSSNDIVIGHSLENDLRAARWIHPHIIDTAILFRVSSRRFKFKLRYLALQLLKVQIQHADKAHCSEEDAVTALQLAVRRAIDGPSFDIQDKREMNRLEAMAQTGTTVCIGPSEWLQQHVTCQPNAIHALSCETIRDPNTKAVSAWLTGPKRRARLLWGRWTIDESKEDMDEVESLVKDLVTKVSFSNTLLAIALQTGYEGACNLAQQRRVRQSPKTTMSWSVADEEAWNKAVDDCRIGHMLWIGAACSSYSNGQKR